MIKYNKEDGAALIIVMILIIVIPVFLGAILQYSLLSQKSVITKRKNTQAYYLARAGAEAVIEAWKQYDLSEKPETISDTNKVKIDKLYLTNNGQFVRKIPKKDYIGSVNVTIKKEDDHTRTFTAVADVNGKKQTVTATVSAYVDGKNVDWYDEENGSYKINAGSNADTAEYNGISYTIRYHDPIPGVVVSGDKNHELELRNNNDENKVAYIADMIEFKSEFDFVGYGDDYGGLVASGETLIFNKEINLEDRLSDNTLILNVPDGLGIKLKDKAGIYGRVYFHERVNIIKGILVNWFDEILIDPSTSETKAYYFKKTEKGVNLLEIEKTSEGKYKQNGEVVLIPIPPDDENRFEPDPEEELRIIWN